jgi:hypothetical protein
LTISREISLSPLGPNDNDLALANARQGHMSIVKISAEVLALITSHIPKVLPIRVLRVDEVAKPQVRVEANHVLTRICIVKKLIYVNAWSI